MSNTMANHMVAGDLPKYMSCEHIIKQIAKTNGCADWMILKLSDEVYEERNAQCDIDSWNNDEKTSWYEYRIWCRLCRYILNLLTYLRRQCSASNNSECRFSGGIDFPSDISVVDHFNDVRAHRRELQRSAAQSPTPAESQNIERARFKKEAYQIDVADIRGLMANACRGQGFWDVGKDFGVSFQFEIIDRWICKLRSIWVEPCEKPINAINLADETGKLNHAYHFLEFWKWCAVKGSEAGEPELVNFTTACESYMDSNSIQIQEWVKSRKQNQDPRQGIVLESRSVRHWRRYSSSMMTLMESIIPDGPVDPQQAYSKISRCCTSVQDANNCEGYIRHPFGSDRKCLATIARLGAEMTVPIKTGDGRICGDCSRLGKTPCVQVWWDFDACRFRFRIFDA